MNGRFLRASLLAAASLALVAGCAGTPGVDDFDRDSVDFLSAFKYPESAREVAYFDSVGAGAASSSAVVVGHVTDVGVTRQVIGEVPTDKVFLIGLTVHIDEVISGHLNDGDEDEIVVEFLGGSDPAKGLDQMRVPVGKSVWFLHSKAEGSLQRLHEVEAAGRSWTDLHDRVARADAPYYRLISSQGLFIQGEHSVVNPLGSDGGEDEGMTADGEEREHLSDLIGSLR